MAVAGNWIAVASARAWCLGALVPWRRDVAYPPAREMPIHPLLDRLEFVEDRQRWGYKFRLGLFEVNEHDMRLIAEAMAVPAGMLYFSGGAALPVARAASMSPLSDSGLSSGA